MLFSESKFSKECPFKVTLKQKLYSKVLLIGKPDSLEDLEFTHHSACYYIEKNVKIMSQDDITSSAREDRFQSLCGRS